MQVIFKSSAIVAVFCALTFIYGCGQRGSLYVPKVPELPADIETAPAPSNAAATPDDAFANSATSSAFISP